MYRFCLILIAALVLSTMGIAVASAAESGDGSMDTLAAYLHGHRLPLVEARMITYRDGQRSLLLYGFVATPYGKRDAEDQARDFIDDPDVEIVNRIKIRPELLTLGTPANKSNSPPAQAAVNAGADDSEDSADATAAQTEDFPDVIGDREAYANQERDDELLMGNGTGGIPLALAIVGSGFIFPPISPPIVAPPIYYNGLPPYGRPPAFGRPPIVFSSPPPIVVMRPIFSPPPTAFQGFQSPFGPSPFPAGSTPMFPATGGMPPFATTINPAFGGFNGPGFTNHGGFGGGFGIGGGFGGRR